MPESPEWPGTAAALLKLGKYSLGKSESKKGVGFVCLGNGGARLGRKHEITAEMGMRSFCRHETSPRLNLPT